MDRHSACTKPLYCLIRIPKKESHEPLHTYGGQRLTAANAMPTMLASLLDAQVVAITRGGARLAEFANPATKTGSRVLQALDGNEAQAGPECFGYVIMQDMSHLPATNPSAHERAVAKICELARNHNAAPALYGTWGYRADSAKLKKLGMSAAQMGRLMHEGSLRAATAHGAIFVDMAKAVAQMEDAGWFYAADGVHPSPAGSQLVAQTIAGALRC